MNFNILLFIYENNEKLKKINLEEGEYSVGKDKSCEIVIKDENIADKHFEIKIKKSGKVYIIPANKKFKILLNEENVSKSEKTEITEKSEITFPDCDKKIIIKKKEIKRERSRSKPIEKNQIEKSKTKQKSSDNHEVHVISKNEHFSDDKYKHIKSEVVWNAVEFDNKSKKDKFLRLMGAKKHNKHHNPETTEMGEDKELSEKLAQNFRKIQKDLEDQFDNSRKR